MKTVTSAADRGEQFPASAKASDRTAPERVGRNASQGRWERFYAIVRRVPRGRVATYGQIAALAGLPRHARQVGYALHALPEDSDVPWHRVVNARGAISPRSTPGWDGLQRRLLERERVLSPDGTIDLERFRWEPPPAGSRSGAPRRESRGRSRRNYVRNAPERRTVED